MHIRLLHNFNMELVCVEDFEKKAFTKLEKNALDYYRSGAGEQFTLGLNREAFKRFVSLLLIFYLISNVIC